MGTSNPYASNKAILHMDRLLAIRAGEQPPPVHLHFIISDLCNQDCIAAGTMIECPGGARPVKDLRLGDQVVGPDGVPVSVEVVRVRWADNLYEITIDGRTVRATGNHPVLTQDGWKKIETIVPGRDSAAVRMRLRVADELEPAPATVGSLYIQTPKGANNDTLCNQDAGPPGGSGQSESAAVPVRMRLGSEHPSSRRRELLGGLSSGASAPGKNRNSLGRQSPGEIQSHEGSKSHAAARSESALLLAEERSSFPDRERVHRMGHANAHSADLYWGSRSWPRQDISRGSHATGFPAAEPTQSNRDYHSPGSGRNKGTRSIRAGADSGIAGHGVAMLGDLRNTGSMCACGSRHQDHRQFSAPEFTLERSLEFRQVSSVRRIPGRFPVYNFACPPIEAYIANGIVLANCSFCAYRIENYTENFSVIAADGSRNHNPNRMIPAPKAMEILEDFKTMGGKAVQFTGGGEPTVHPQCREIMEHALELGLEVALVTNGVRLPKVADTLMRAVWTRISIDASREETYTSVRRVPPDHWRKVHENVAALVHQREKQGSKLTVGIGFVVTRENWREVKEAAKQARDHGADNLRISAMFQPDDAAYFDGFHAEAAALCREAEALSGNGFRVINNFGTRVADLEQQSPDYKRCGYMNFTTYIGADLNLYRCCVLSYTDRGTVGSLKDKRLLDLWRSDEKRADFAKFDARSCPRCQFNDKNHDINRIIEELPVMHGNFV